MLRAALAGDMPVPEQKPTSETWMGLALYYNKGLVSLEDVLGAADALTKGIPNPNEVAWAFLRLKKRGWLVAQGDLYGLTSEGRLAIDTIIQQGNFERLNKWISRHPPTGPITAREVFLNLRKDDLAKEE